MTLPQLRVRCARQATPDYAHRREAHDDAASVVRMTATTPSAEPTASAEASADELHLDRTVVATQELIRINTSNYGEGKSEGEEPAAEYLAARLESLDLAVHRFDAAPGRRTVVTRIPGRNPDKPALVLHAHTDVVPADPADWSVDPFGGEIRDGYLWGRGAVDLKNFDAIIVTALEDLLREGIQPEREIVVAFFADEESGGALGSHAIVNEHPEYFSGATEGVSEVGGYSITIGQKRAYLIQTGEKGIRWIKLHARGESAHGSRVIPAYDNPIARLAGAVARIAEHEWPAFRNRTNEATLEALGKLLGLDPASATVDEIVAAAGPGAGFLAGGLRTTANPTILQAGYKHNVIPERASVALDIRVFPGDEDATIAEIQRLAGPGIEVEVNWADNGIESDPHSHLVTAAGESLRRFDPEAEVVPYFLSAGTDGKALSRLGIAGFGFVPQRLPAGFDFPAQFHAVDERVPLDALVFGREVLKDFLRSY